MGAQDLSGYYGAFAPGSVSARSAALAGTQAGIGAADDAAFCSPAALAGAGAQSVSFHYHRLFGMVPVMAAQYSRPSGFGTIGLGLMSQGDELYRENTVSAVWARQLRFKDLRCDAGAAMLVYAGAFGSENRPESIHGSVWGQGLHLGFRLWCSESVVLGAAVKNALNTLRWSTSGAGDYDEALPVQLILGIGLIRTELLSAGFDWEPGLTRELPDRFHTGLEKSWMQFLTLRAGTWWTAGDPDMNGFTAGLSFTRRVFGRRRLTFDAAYSIEILPNTLRFSLIFN